MGIEAATGHVRLEKIKRPGGVFWYDLQPLGQDSDGTWLHGPAGSPWGAPHDRGALSVPVVVLLAADRPWVAWWVNDPADQRYERGRRRPCPGHGRTVSGALISGCSIVVEDGGSEAP